ncbi:MAG: DUF2029 domain-containing protein [Candidatus Aminicenantes bacterium]|nr:DUF2029 domain-containing protein [Candidatus Aminicenantes bacterium]
MPLKKGPAIILLLAILFFLLVFFFKVKDEMIDFQVNYVAGKRLRWAETLYRFEDEHYMFKYLPSSAFLYLPLSYLPLKSAKMVWYFLTIICAGFIILISYRLLANGEKSKYLLVLPLLITLRYYSRELFLGQINTLVTLSLLLMTWYIVSESKEPTPKKDIFAGFFWGLGMAMKPYAVIFFPYLIIKKKWRSLASGIIFLGAALLAPAMFYGFRGNYVVLKEWYSTLARTTPQLLSSLDNISLIACFTKWTGDPQLSLVLSTTFISLLAVMILAVILMGRELPRASVLECGLCLMVIPLVSPLGWDYTLLTATLGIMLLIRYYPAFTLFARILLLVNFVLITFAFYDLLGKEMYTTFMQWSVTTVNFLILCGYLAYLRIKKIC